MIKRGKLRNLCLLAMTAFSITIVSGCSGQEAATTTAAADAATTASEAVTEAGSAGDDQAAAASAAAELPEIVTVFEDSAYLEWTLTDEFSEETTGAGSVLINWDEEAGTGTILKNGDQISRADIKELIFYSAFGTYTIEEITSPEGVTAESFSGTDQKLELPESAEETSLSLSVRYELTLETEEIVLTIQP